MKFSRFVLLLLSVSNYARATRKLDQCTLDMPGIVSEKSYGSYTSNTCSESNELGLLHANQKNTEYQCIEWCFRHGDCVTLHYDGQKKRCVLFKVPKDTLTNSGCFNPGTQTTSFATQVDKTEFRANVS